MVHCLASCLRKKSLHFHLHPSPIHDYQYPEYEAEARKNPYFHIHPSIDFDKVQDKVSSYDFGWFANPYHQYGYTSETYRKHAIATKVCTFLEAGIPVVANRTSTSGLWTSYPGLIAGFWWGEDAPRGLGDQIRPADLPRLLRGVENARNRMDIHNRAPELLDFILKAKDRYEKNPVVSTPGAVHKHTQTVGSCS